MKIIADTHCHTIASTHAYSTAMENIIEAKNQGLYALALTDHCEYTPGSPGTWFFNNLRAIPREVQGVKVLRGAEANVLNAKGDLDLPKNLHKPLDWIVASMHDVAYTGIHDTDECTEAWLSVSKNPSVNVIGHSGSASFVYDYDKVIPEFGRNGKLVEINNSSFMVRKGSESNCKKIASLCKKYGVPIIVNSDSHFCTSVGRFDKALKLLEEVDFPEELVINADIDRFNGYLEKYTGFFEI